MILINSERLNRDISNAIQLQCVSNIMVGDFNYPSSNWEDVLTSKNNTHALNV